MKPSADRGQRRLAARLLERHPDEAARTLENARLPGVLALLEETPPTQAAEVLKSFTPDRAAALIAGLSEERARQFLARLEPYRTAALLARMEDDVQARILGLLEPASADELRALIAYPDGSAGRLMDPRVTAFRPETTVRDVVHRLKELRRKSIQDIFLIDAEGLLVGSVPLQDVVLAQPSQRLAELARAPTPMVRATSSRESVLEELELHKVGSLPIVDFDGRLLGVLRQEQLVRAAQREASVGMLKMVGVSQEERALSSPLFAVKKRLPWLQVNLLTAFLAAAVVGLFEGTIARFTALAVLLPVVAGQSGNTGAQALAVTMRGLALREIRLRHWMRIGSKELLVGFANGVAVAATTALGVFVWSRSEGLALVIGASMVLSMTAAGLAGATVPMVLTALRQDPAQSASIVLTTVTDVVGFLSFLGIATLLSGML